MKDGNSYLETDVLIIGAGGAGAMAAIEAVESGGKAILLSKSGFPSGCTPVAMGAMQASMDLKDSPDTHLKDTVIGGCYLNNQELVRVMANEVPGIVKQLEEFGTEFRKEGEDYKLFPMGACTYPRAVCAKDLYTGGFVKGLTRKVRELNIKVVEDTMATKLLQDGDRIVGITGIDVKTGELSVILAKSVILASGGAGNLYPLTTNPGDVSGDGFALAYKAGAELIDMEFIQMRAIIISPPKLKGLILPLDGLGTIGGRFYNARGERYMKRYHGDKAETVTRDAIGLAAFLEVREGRGTSQGGVYSDFSGVPEEELSRFSSFLEKCQAADHEPRWQPTEWAPGVHHFMGGVRINENCETSIEGLFAAGEVTGGIHGANRMAGNALADILVFGARAGKNAAAKALTGKAPLLSKFIASEIEEERQRIDGLATQNGRLDSMQLIDEIKGLMNDYVGVVRNQDGLQKAVEGLCAIKETLSNLQLMKAETTSDLRTALDVENLVTVGLIVASAALARKETRGAHCNEDYPTRDDANWLANIVIRHQGQDVGILTVPAVLTEVSPK